MYKELYTKKRAGFVVWNTCRLLAAMLLAALALSLTGPVFADSAESVFKALKFTRLVYSAETRPDLVAGALRYASSRTNQPLSLRLERAERLSREGKADAAIRHYEIVAYYGDKYAQYRIGWIHAYGLGDLEPDPVDALAWFALSAEHPDVRADVEPRMLSLWANLSASERDRARSRVADLARDYSNLAVLDRTQEHLRRRMLERTGTRLANAKGGMLASSEGIYEYDKIQREIRMVDNLLDQVGNVELGELVVLEPRAPAGRPGASQADSNNRAQSQQRDQ